MSAEICQIMSEAVARCAAGVLSLPIDQQWRHFRTRLLEQTESGLVIAAVPADTALLEDYILQRHEAALTFRASDGGKVTCTLLIWARKPNYILADQRVDALLLSFPIGFQVLQKRSSCRVSIAPATGLSLRVWQIEAEADLDTRPAAACEIPVELRDFGVGGAGMIYRPQDAQQVQWGPGQRLRLKLDYRGEKLLLEGRTRNVTRLDDNSVRVGIEFVGLQSSLRGRKMISVFTSIISELQRQAVHQRKQVA